jgi:hypothetical protein
LEPPKLSFSHFQATFQGAQDTQSLKRDLNKAFLGFSGASRKKIITGREICCTIIIFVGHWGCGAFGCNKQLQFLIQLLAEAEGTTTLCCPPSSCSSSLVALPCLPVYADPYVAGFALDYVPYDTEMSPFTQMYQRLVELEVTVGQLFLVTSIDI